MTVEIMTIVAVGVALAGVIISLYSRGAAGDGAVGIAAGWEDRCVGVSASPDFSQPPGARLKR